MAGLAATLNSLTSSAASSTSQNGETTSPVTVTAAHNSVGTCHPFLLIQSTSEIKFSRSTDNVVQPSVAPTSSNYGATANVRPGQQLHVDIHATAEAEARTSSPLLDDAILTEEQAGRIESAARTVYSLLTHIEPRLVQNKRRISRYTHS